MERDGMARRKSLKTSTVQEVRKAVSRVINMVLNGELDSKAANSIILGCNAILSSIKADDQQKKIEDLERQVRQKDNDVDSWKAAIIEIAKRRGEK